MTHAEGRQTDIVDAGVRGAPARLTGVIAPLWASGGAGAPPIAIVRVAAPLEPGVAARLEETVCRLAGERISVRIEEAADIIGGVWIRIGDTVIDGSVRGRLAVLRQHLCAHCQLALSSGDEEPPAAPSQAQ